MINRSIKIIRNLHYLHHTDDLYSESLLPLEKLNKFNSIFLIFKIKNNIIKHNFQLVQRRDIHSHATRRVSDFAINFTNSCIGEKDILSHSISLYNNLPTELKKEKKISAFKQKLKIYLFNNN